MCSDMRKRLFILLAALLAFSTDGPARNALDRLRFGVEWGYSHNMYNKYKYTIISAAEGYKLSEKGEGWMMAPHLLCQFSCEYLVNEKVSTALIIGYKGIGESTRLFPLLFRLNWYYSSMQEDGFFSFVEFGGGFQENNAAFNRNAAFLSGIGEGYRLKLSTRFSLDVLLNLSYAYDKPAIPNPDGPGYVLGHNILSNFSEYYALNLSFRVSF